MYSFDSRVRYSEVGGGKLLTPLGIINYFQDCSTFQSEDLGIGIEYLQDRRLVWVLSSWQIVIDRYPKLGEHITISTWPYKFQRFNGFRNFTMTDSGGQMTAWANSVWSFLNTDTWYMERVPEDIWQKYGIEPPLEMDYASRKLPLPSDCTRNESFAVQQHHLDTNHHVNNGQYIAMALEYIPEDFTVRQIRAEYKRSAKLGDIICPMTQSAGGICTVGLCDEAGRPYTVVELS